MTRRVLVTGADGFIAQNFELALRPRRDVEFVGFRRGDGTAALHDMVRQADMVFHLAGANRPSDESDFKRDNAELTEVVADAVRAAVEHTGRKIALVLSSSTKAADAGPYGSSKLRSERLTLAASEAGGFPAFVFRLPNVFGKWARPNYNSAVATFCHNIARDLPIVVHDPLAPLQLLYVDDLVATFIGLLDGVEPAVDRHGSAQAGPVYETTVGEVAAILRSFRESRESLTVGPVGCGLTRALYATYTSYLPREAFSYPITAHEDPRGVFAEMLRTETSGQFSFFTAHPGVTRGSHYHNSKTEKFLVVKGKARFGFRHMRTNEVRYVETDESELRIVDTVPGWTHDITNIGDDLLIALLWANELFDPAAPDTFASKVDPAEEGAS